MKLNSGTYGCIYKSEKITCSNDRPTHKDKYIAKVVEMKYSKIEFEIGQEIQEKIPCYEYFFAPMEYKCDVEINTLDNNLMNECSAVKDVKDPEDIGIGKIRNIHRPNEPSKIYTLTQIVDEWLNEPDTTLFKTRYLDTFQYLLKSIQRLENIGIIHNDLKGNNILYDAFIECPIIIDFGMSMKIETIQKPDPLKNPDLIFVGSNFFTNLFESVLLGKLKKNAKTPPTPPTQTLTSSITNIFQTQPTTTTSSQTIDRETLKEWLYEFINDEDEFQNVFKHGAFNEEQQRIFTENYERKIDEWILQDKPADPETLFKTIFDEIKNKIDIYALGITHLYFCLENPKLKEIDWTFNTNNTNTEKSTDTQPQGKTISFFDHPNFQGAFHKVFAPYYYSLYSKTTEEPTTPNHQ